MIVHRGIEQGTEPWLRMRAGIPTASQASRIITPTGKPSASAERYMLELLAERITGEAAVEAPKLWWAERGKELEERAHTGYEFERNVEVDPVSFVTDDTGRFGCSPDGLVGEDGLVEFKAPNAADHMAILLKTGTAAKEYGVQCQFQLFVCSERKWVDLSSYYPALPQGFVRIARDEEFQKLMAKEVLAFSERLEALYAQILADGWSTQWKRLTKPLESKAKPDLSQSALLDTMRDVMGTINR